MKARTISTIAAAWFAALAALGGCRGENAPTGSAADKHEQGSNGDSDAHGSPFEKAIPRSLPDGAPWCDEHGVPESHCTRCDPSLIPKFKQAEDWCDGHDLPESQCLICNPQLRAKWEALRPKSSAPAAAAADNAVRTEPTRRLLTANGDPLCQVDRLQIRLKDNSVADKAGIKAEAVALRRISSVVECPGEVAYDQNRLAHVTPRVKGVIVRSVAELGSAVESGDLLAFMDSPALGEAKSRYIELREKHLLAKADYERAKLIHTGVRQILDQCETMTSAEEVRQKFAEVRIGEAKSRLLKAHTDLELARATFERKAGLREQGITSEQALETARGGLQAAQAEFHAVHEEIGFVSEREVLTSEKALRIAKNAMDVAERQLHILGIDQESVAALETTPDTTLLTYELRSPLSGRVVERHAVVGESVDEKDAPYTVADLSSVWLMLDVPERDLIALRVGLPVLFTVDGLPGNSFQGALTWISSQVDDRTRTVKARAELPNDTGLLRANMFGRARVVLHDNEEVPTIPDEAVQTDGCCQLVFVKEADALYRPRKVALGSAANGYVEIQKGLQIGEIVVTSGSFLMKTEILKGNIGAGCCEVDPGR